MPPVFARNSLVFRSLTINFFSQQKVSWGPSAPRNCYIAYIKAMWKTCLAPLHQNTFSLSHIVGLEQKLMKAMRKTCLPPYYENTFCALLSSFQAVELTSESNAENMSSVTGARHVFRTAFV